jgi:hypothetical protein
VVQFDIMEGGQRRLKETSASKGLRNVKMLIEQDSQEDGVRLERFLSDLATTDRRTVGWSSLHRLRGRRRDRSDWSSAHLRPF